MPLDWRTVHLPLAAGINGRVDPRALQPPELLVCKDAQFAELGGLQTRKPYAAMSLSVVGGGTIANPRKLVTDGDELLLFTKGSIYSWSVKHSAWAFRNDYIAPKVTEGAIFVRSDDQIFADRAELAGVAVVVWQEAGSGSSIAYVAATDTVTGAVLMAPTAIGGAARRPRVSAQLTKILLTYVDGADLQAVILDPADVAGSLATGTASPTTIDATAVGYYDVAVDPTLGNAYVAYATSGGSGTTRVTEALVLTAVTSTREATRVAVAVLDSAIWAPGQVHVLRWKSSTNEILADRYDLALTSIQLAQNLGTPTGSTVNQITAAFSTSPDGGQHRCYVWWSTDETANASTGSFVTQTNYVDSAGTVGSTQTFIRRCGIGSRAFDHAGRVYVWLVFAGESRASGMGEPLGLRAQLQNTYYLYRAYPQGGNNYAEPWAKAVMNRAGGFGALEGHLPGVQLTATNAYTFAGVERRIIQLGSKQTGYADRGPRVVTLEFDSNEARRVVRLGRTLYITGGQLVQHDGEIAVEVGFHVFPWYFGTVAVGSGSLAAGSYTYKSTVSWLNARGDFERSTTATATSLTVTAGQKVQFSMTNLYITRKKNTRTPPALEVWRTQVDPSIDSPCHLITSNDPADTSNPNRYLANDPTASFASSLEDDLVDADLARRETNPENGGILENLAPPPATIIAASQDRLFLAGIAGSPDQIWYSKFRNEGEVAAFHDALVVNLPPDGGPITALEFHNETLIAFKESAVYAIPGDGYDNAGEGQNYGPARLISEDVGAVSAEAVARTAQGLYFKSAKGWYRVPAGAWAVEYVGGPVVDFDAETVVAAHAMESEHEIRILTTARMLAYDTLAGQWSERTVAGGLSAAMWNGTHVILTATGARIEQTTYGAEACGLDVELAWIKTADLQGYQRLRRLIILGEYRSAHRLRIRIAYDYDETWIDDETWTVTPTTVGGPLQVRMGPSRQKCQAFKVRISALDTATSNPPTGEALKLTGLGLEIGIKGGLYRRLPAAQKI